MFAKVFKIRTRLTPFRDDVRFQPEIMTTLFQKFEIAPEGCDSIEKLALSTGAGTSCLLQFGTKIFLTFR